MNKTQRNCLYRLLALTDESLAIAILKAIEQIGDSNAISYVTALTVVDNRRVWEAAQQCLPFLEERIEKNRVSHALLRPAGLQTDTPDVLLRPAAAHSDTEPQQLLRANSGE